MDIVPYRPEHLQAIELQDSQLYLENFITDDLANALVDDKWSWTGIIDGKVICCAGVQTIWDGRGVAWAYIAGGIEHDFIKIHRAVKSGLDQCDLNRIEITVDCGFKEGHRWANMLGFKLEAGRMRGFTPSGQDHSLYARLK